MRFSSLYAKYYPAISLYAKYYPAYTKDWWKYKKLKMPKEIVVSQFC